MQVYVDVSSSNRSFLTALRSTSCPYTTLFRSVERHGQAGFASYSNDPGDIGRVVVAFQKSQLGFTKRSEEHTYELRHRCISYAVFCLKKKKNKDNVD